MSIRLLLSDMLSSQEPPRFEVDAEPCLRWLSCDVARGIRPAKAGVPWWWPKGVRTNSLYHWLTMINQPFRGKGQLLTPLLTCKHARGKRRWSAVRFAHFVYLKFMRTRTNPLMLSMSIILHHDWPYSANYCSIMIKHHYESSDLTIIHFSTCISSSRVDYFSPSKLQLWTTIHGDEPSFTMMDQIVSIISPSWINMI